MEDLFVKPQTKKEAIEDILKEINRLIEIYEYDFDAVDYVANLEYLKRLCEQKIKNLT